MIMHSTIVHFASETPSAWLKTVLLLQTSGYESVIHTPRKLSQGDVILCNPRKQATPRKLSIFLRSRHTLKKADKRLTRGTLKVT